MKTKLIFALPAIALFGIYIAFADEHPLTENKLPEWVVFKDKEKEKIFIHGYAAAFEWIENQMTVDPERMIPDEFQEDSSHTLLWMQGFSVGQWEAWYQFPSEDK